MKIRVNFIYILIIAFLIILLILGHQINKQNSASKKNEISNIVNQLKTRNNQLAKIQKNLFEEGKNLNDIINKKEITFENIFKDKKLDGLKVNSEKLITIGKYCLSWILKIVSTKIELSKYIELIIHLGNIVEITKKNKKIYSVFLDINKKIMQFKIINL